MVTATYTLAEVLDAHTAPVRLPLALVLSGHTRRPALAQPELALPAAA